MRGSRDYSKGCEEWGGGMSRAAGFKKAPPGPWQGSGEEKQSQAGRVRGFSVCPADDHTITIQRRRYSQNNDMLMGASRTRRHSWEESKEGTNPAAGSEGPETGHWQEKDLGESITDCIITEPAG